jgi:predicted GNAT family acetyltransferase
VVRQIAVLSILVAAIGVAGTVRAADDPLLAAYRQFYAGEREEARRQFERLVAANPSALPARFGLLQVIGDQARTQPELSAEFERQLDAFLRDADARHSRSESDDEALFYLENGYVLRSLFRVREDHLWGAARDAARSKRLAEAYISRHPEHGDAYLGLGLYNYYVAIAPAYVRVLRVLLFLPPGSRADGLKQIERTYTQGSLFSYHAALVLMELYGTYEGRAEEAVRIGERLAREYPGNPAVQFQLAELYLSPGIENYGRAAEQYRAVIAREQRRPDVRSDRYLAELGLASALQQQWRLDEAVRLLTSTINVKPASPAWVMPRFLLRRANYRALLGDPAAADDARTVLANRAWKDRHKQATELLKWMDTRRASGEAAIYALLIPANRLVAERRWSEASAAYETIRRDHPNDPQVRFRAANLQFERGDAEGSMPAFAALAAESEAPGWLRSQALLHIARAHDLAGRRAEAKKVYQRIVDDYDDESAADAARIGLLAPYRRRSAASLDFRVGASHIGSSAHAHVQYDAPMTGSGEDSGVRDNADQQRYEIRVGGDVAFLQYHDKIPGRRTLVHTEVPPALEGKGIGGRLVKAALEDARASRRRIVPLCPFVRGYLTRHPEFDDLIAGGTHS